MIDNIIFLFFIFKIEKNIKNKHSITKMASINDLKYINEASMVATNSPCYNQHGCVIVKNGKIVSHGYNHYNVSSNSLSSTTTHAEIDALTKYMRLNGVNSKGIYAKGNKSKANNSKGNKSKIQQETQ